MIINLYVAPEAYDEIFLHILDYDFNDGVHLKLEREFQEWIYKYRLHHPYTKIYAQYYTNLFDNDIRLAIKMLSG